MGGGGNLANLKSLLSVAAVLVASLLVTACPAPDDGVGTVTPRGPNTDAATQLKKLEVLYKGTTAPNLITFNTSVAEDEEQMGEYALNNPTDATKAFVTVNAEAKSAGAEIQIWWTNGNDGGGMGEAVPASGVITLSDIPVPSTEDNTYIYVNLTNGVDENGDPKMFEYMITVPPPIIDTTLSGIVLSTGSLTPSFNPKVTNYSVTGLEERISVLVTATANDVGNAKVKIDEGAGTSNSASATVTVPDSGEAPLVVKIAVTNGDNASEGIAGMTSTYTISIVPPQAELDEDSTLQDIQFYFSDDDANTDDITVMVGGAFKSDKTKYTFDNIPNGVTKIKLGWATARSSSSKKIAVTQGTATQSSYASSETENDKSVLNGTFNAIALPAKGSGQILTFKVVVTAQNNSTTPYQFDFSNPAKNANWQGTMEASGISDIAFDYAEVEYVGLDGLAHSKASNELTQPGNKWAVSLDDRITPTAFVAVAIVNGATYRQSFPVDPSKKTGNVLQMNSSMARMIFNAQGLAKLSETDNRNVNWFLANDIDLAESGEWVPPGSTANNAYAGTFDGNGKTISNLRLSRTTGDTGLFGNISNNAVLKNFTVEVVSPEGGLEMEGASHFGGVIGQVLLRTTDVILKDIKVTGRLEYKAIKTNASLYLMVGGFIGEVNGTTHTAGKKVFIENCVSDLTVVANLGETNKYSTGTNPFHITFGGFIGRIFEAELSIKNSASLKPVTVTHGNASGEVPLAAGGFIGNINDNNASQTANTGTVLSIENSFSLGAVKLVKTNGASLIAAGGSFIGAVGNETTVNVTNSAALGEYVLANNVAATDKQYYGRIVGFTRTGSTLNLSNNFALDTMKVGATSSTAAVVTDGTASDAKGLDKTIGNFKSASTWTASSPNGLGFSTSIWDFSNIATTGYPTLK